MYMTYSILIVGHKATAFTVVFRDVHRSVFNKTGREIDIKTDAGQLFSVSSPFLSKHRVASSVGFPFNSPTYV